MVSNFTLELNLFTIFIIFEIGIDEKLRGQAAVVYVGAQSKEYDVQPHCTLLIFGQFACCFDWACRYFQWF